MNLLLVARSEAELARLAKELQADGSTVAVAAVDLGGPHAARQVAEAAAAELGAVDVLVNNAATEPQTRFHVLTSAEIEHVLHVDLISPLLLARLVLPGMLERRYGRIVNISSLAGHTSFPHTEAYAAAKDGLTAFSRVLTSDYRGTGVAATSLILGPVKDTGVSARTLAETGLTTSTAFSVKPEKVAAATLRAIAKPKAEIVISIGPGRRLSRRSWTTSPAWARPSTGSAAPTSSWPPSPTTAKPPAPTRPATTTPSPYSPARPPYQAVSCTKARTPRFDPKASVHKIIPGPAPAGKRQLRTLNGSLGWRAISDPVGRMLLAPRRRGRVDQVPPHLVASVCMIGWTRALAWPLCPAAG